MGVYETDMCASGVSHSPGPLTCAVFTHAHTHKYIHMYLCVRIYICKYERMRG